MIIFVFIIYVIYAVVEADCFIIYQCVNIVVQEAGIYEFIEVFHIVS